MTRNPVLNTVLILSVVFAIFIPVSVFSEEIRWADYKKPLQNIIVYDDEDVDILVTLPEHYLIDKKKVKLGISVKSFTRLARDQSYKSDFQTYLSHNKDQ